MTSNDTFHHLLGGFLGGLAGILAFGYIYSLLSPSLYMQEFVIGAGCLLGAIVGFWHDAIYEKIRFDHSWIRLRTPHPVTRAEIVSLFLALLFLAPAIGQIWLFYWSADAIFGNSYGVAGIMTLLWTIGTVVGLVILEIAYFFEWRETRRKLDLFYTQWDSWNKSKPLFLGSAALDLLRGQVFIMGFLAGVFGSIMFRFIYLCCTVLPMSLFFSAMKGIYAAAQRGGYWICFVTSFVTTSGFAYLMTDRLHEPKTLWITALLAGAVSAAGSEGFRQFVLWFATRNARFRGWTEKPAHVYADAHLTFAMEHVPKLLLGFAERWNLKQLAPKFISVD